MSNKKVRAILCAVALLALPEGLWSLSAQEPEEWLLVNARLLDPASQSVRSVHLQIRGTRIEALLGEEPPGFKGHRVDVEGKWVIPGLVDLHTHSFGNTSPAGGRPQFLGTPGTARVMLYSGVTAFLDLFYLEDAIFQLRSRQQAGEIPGAQIMASGPCITATNGHCTEYGIRTRVINNPEEARREIGELAPKAPDVVKLVYDNASGRMPTIDRETLQAAVEAARLHGLRTVIHVGTWQDVRDAAEAGASAVTHTPPGAPSDDLIQLLLNRKVAVIPTLTVHTEMANLSRQPDLLERPLLRQVAAETILDSYRDTTGFQERLQRWLQAQKESRQDSLGAVRRLSRSGVKILVGTDAGNPGVFQGYSVHRELELLVEAGLSPWGALAAATTNAGEFMGQPWGAAPGSLANLVVLSASPLEDISNTQRIEQVIFRGRIVDRPALLPE